MDKNFAFLDKGVLSGSGLFLTGSKLPDITNNKKANVLSSNINNLELANCMDRHILFD